MWGCCWFRIAWTTWRSRLLEVLDYGGTTACFQQENTVRRVQKFSNYPFSVNALMLWIVFPLCFYFIMRFVLDICVHYMLETQTMKFKLLLFWKSLCCSACCSFWTSSCTVLICGSHRVSVADCLDCRSHVSCRFDSCWTCETLAPQACLPRNISHYGSFIVSNYHGAQ